MKSKKEYSKILMSLIMATYFIGLIVGLYVVLRILLITPEYSVQALIALFSYIGAPVTGAIGFYFSSKTKENLHKYTQGSYYNEYLYTETPADDDAEGVFLIDEEDDPR